MNQNKFVSVALLVTSLLTTTAAFTGNFKPTWALAVLIATAFAKSFSNALLKATDYAAVTIIGLVGTGLGAVSQVAGVGGKWSWITLLASSLLLTLGSSLRAIVGPAATVAPLVLLLLVPTFSVGCDQNDKQKIVVASGDIYAGLKGASDYVYQLNRTYTQPDPAKPAVKELSDADALALYHALDKIGLSVKAIKDRALALDTIGPDNRVQLFPLLDGSITDIDTLEKEGVLSIKNEKRRAELTAFLETTRAGLNATRISIIALKRPVKASALPIATLGTEFAR